MISVVIPVYRKTEMFLKNLKNNIHYLRGTHIVVVNDDPGTPLKHSLGPYKVTLIENATNLGFSGTVNKGVEFAKGEFVLLLNTDVVLYDTSYTKALNTLQNDSKVFAVTFAQREKDNTIVGKNTLYWDRGFMQHKKVDDISKGINGWAEGGSCMINKSYFDELGGFDTLFAPFYWEDLDLSYRAWKAGYKVIFDPSILVEHHHESTIGTQFEKEFVQTIAFRNQLLFIWKNIEDNALLEDHIKHLSKYLVKNFGQSTVRNGFIQALRKIPEVLQKRKQNPTQMTDAAILKMLDKSIQ